MKASKALKRLGKIEALVSDVTKRYSANAPRIREVLKDLNAAFARVKEAVSLQASSGMAKKKAAAAKTGRAVKKSAPFGKKTAVRLTAAKAAKAKTAKKPAPIKKAVKKKTPAKKPAPILQAATVSAAEEPMPALPTFHD